MRQRRHITCIHVEIYDAINFVSVAIHFILSSTNVEANVLQDAMSLCVSLDAAVSLVVNLGCRIYLAFTSLEKLEMVRTVLVECWLSRNSSLLYLLLVSMGRGVSPLSEDTSQLRKGPFNSPLLLSGLVH